MHDIGYSCDITSSIEKSDQVGKNFELAVVASMAFFKWKNVDMYRLCNGNKNTTSISTIVGMKETNKDTGKSNYEEKQEAFTNRTSVAFMVDNCKWDVKESPKQTPKQGKWHEPVDNPQITIWTQSGRNEPSNAVFGAKRPNGHYHQGLDIFCVEGTKVYACLDGTIEAISKAYSGQGQTIVLKITDKEQLEAFRKRRLSYIPFYKGEWKEGPNFNPDSNEIYFVYYHLREILVNSGTVHAGDVIGLSGISGIEKGTHGPHLHFEIRSKRWCNGLNNRCNPAYYVNYRNDKKLSPEEKKRQEDRKNLGQLKDFNGKIKK